MEFGLPKMCVWQKNNHTKYGYQHAARVKPGPLPHVPACLRGFVFRLQQACGY